MVTALSRHNRTKTYINSQTGTECTQTAQVQTTTKKVSALRRGGGYKVPSLKKRLFAIDSLFGKGVSVFSNELFLCM